MGYNDHLASNQLMKWNAKLGSFKQVHMLICIYKNKSIDAAYYQESYFGGGNKNEVILCIGLRDDKIDWCKVISWTEQDKFKVDLEHDIVNMEFNLMEIVDYFAIQVQKRFIRKEFKDFEYINIQPSNRTVIIAFFITFILTIGLSIFFVRNEFEHV